MRMNSQSFQAMSVVVSLLAGRAPVVYADAPIEGSAWVLEEQVLSALPVCRVVPPAQPPAIPCRVDDEDEDPERWDGLS